MEKLTFDDILKRTEEDSFDKSKRMKNGYIVPVYIAIDIDKETGFVSSISQSNLNFMFGKEIITE